MSITTVSSRDFNQDTAGATKAAAGGPVIITERGQPSYVLLSYREYQSLTGSAETIASLLAMPQAADIDFEPVRLGEAFLPTFD
jgi:prevent-host-death family protein